MGCFCHGVIAPLRLMLPKLNIAESAAFGLPGAGDVLSLSAWLSARSLPALPWTPDPAWLNLQLPQMQMNVQAVATISALATLRAQVLAQFGIDLLVPRQATALVRIVATMNARVSALANIQFNPLGWTQLAMLMNAIVQVELPLRAGLLLPSAKLNLALTMPGGVPMARWQNFLAALLSLLPMIAATAQLNVSLAETAQFSVAMRALARISLPPLVAPEFMANLSAALTAVAQLQMHLQLGAVSPLELGLPAIALRVQARLGALMTALRVQLGLNVPPGASLWQILLSLLPQVPVLPTHYATADTVRLAMQMRAVAALNWQVPASLPVIQIGLPTCAFAAQLTESLHVAAVLPAPCGSGCDAAKLMKALA